MSQYQFKTGYNHMHIQEVYDLLTQTYWGNTYELDTLQTALSHSLCFGIFYTPSQRQIAFARVLTDYATRYYIMDVVVDADFRNQGIAQELIQRITTYSPLISLRGILMTKDANKLYEKCGFKPYETTLMHKNNP